MLRVIRKKFSDLDSYPATKIALKSKLGITNLEENQYSGVVVYSTYAELPATGTLLVSYKVSNDPNTALNGYYHWNGSAYVKDADLNDETIQEVFESVVLKAIGLNYEVAGKNIVPNDGYTSGTIRADGSFVASASYSYSPIFRIKESTQYVFSDNETALSTRFACFFDEKLNVISVDTADYESKFTWVSPAGAVFCIVTLANEVIANDLQIEEGSSFTSFEERIIKAIDLSGYDLSAVKGYLLELIEESDNDNSVKSKSWILSAIESALNDIVLLDKLEYVGGNNLLDPAKFIVGAVDGVTGVNSGSTGYRHQWIEVSEGEIYTGLADGFPSFVFRKVAFFADDQTTVVSYGTVENIAQVTVPAGASWFVPSWAVLYNDVVFCGLGTSPSYEPYEFEIKVVGNYNSKSDESLVKRIEVIEGIDRVTLENSDKILYTGSSSIESFYSPTGKSWLMRAQDFVDWVLVPYGWSGQGSQELANYLNTDTPSPSAASVAPSKIKPTYTFCGQTLNMDDELALEDSDAFIEALEELIQAAKGIGSNVAIGTAYTERIKPQLEIAMSNISKKYNAEFIPLAAYADKVIRTQGGFKAYKGFYGNAHPGIRTNEHYTARFLGYLERFKRPERAILIFNARNTAAANSTLAVRNNFERAKVFRTIQIGEKCLDVADIGRYDSLTPYDYGISLNNNSEWLSLLDGNSISVADKSMIEIIVPKTGLSSAFVHIEATGISSIYILNTRTNAWDSVTIDSENKISINVEDNIDFDKIRILLNGSGMTLASVYAETKGGKEKNQIVYPELKPSAGSLIYGGGFPSTWANDWNNPDGITSYNQTIKYGSSDFSDIPVYLSEANHLLLMDYNVGAKKAINRLIDNSNFKDTFGYQKLRIYVTARLKPLIYDPVEYAAWPGGDNPYTDVSWYDENSYDYATLCVGFDYNDGKTPLSIVRKRIGLFWTIQEFEIDVPMLGENDIKIEVWRDVEDKINESWDMELADIRVEVID